MDSYAPLLERTKVPQPSLQKFAVISIFSKLRSAPKHLDSESELGRDAISRCLHSASPPVVDQSVRELCRFVTESNYAVSRALLELQSALEGSDPNLVNLFVKAIGFLVRFEFQRSNGAWRFSSAVTHPFVKVSERNDTSLSPYLVAQNKIFISHCVGFGTVIFNFHNRNSWLFANYWSLGSVCFSLFCSEWCYVKVIQIFICCNFEIAPTTFIVCNILW